MLSSVHKNSQTIICQTLEMHHMFMKAHTPTHNLWLWPKRPPLAYSVAEMPVAEMSGFEMP